MSRCGQCGATSPAGATWCSQCFLPLTPRPVELEYAAAPAIAPALPAPPPPAVPLPAGWRPPADAAPAPGAPTYTATDARADGRLLDRRAIVLVVLAIALGGVMQLVAIMLAHHETIEPERLIRYDIVLTLGFYAVVAAMILSQITPSIRLRWGDGPLLGRVAVGVGFGVAVSGFLLAAVSAASGHLQPDPRVVLMMSEGDPTHIVVAVLIGCVAAPLVEETLFRGLLLESLRPRGVRVAVLISALAFAVWHYMPASIVYYTVMGLALAGLYVKRGLACSIAAHVGFNGLLTVAAIVVVLAPPHPVSLGALGMTAPTGWSTVTTTAPGDLLLLRGPSDAVVEVLSGPTVGAPDADAVAQRLASVGGRLPTGVLMTSQVNTVTVAGTSAVEVDLDAQGHAGTLVVLPEPGVSYELVFMSAGSAKASQDFQRMLTTVHVAGGVTG